ncbi:MAG: MFS transporter [Deltaproteobacteria bacterium]|nr:MFS transporter [Deltaproteobacteria bacterium]
MDKSTAQRSTELSPEEVAADIPIDEPSHQRALQARVFALTWLSYASYYLTRKNFSVVKARLHQELGVSVPALAAIDTAFLIAYASGQFVSGTLGDRLGPRRILAFGMVGSAACAALFGLGSGVLFFALVYGLNGFFQSTGWPNGVKAMEPWFSQKIRGKVMGFWSTNYQVGGLVATALASFLLVRHGWRAAFVTPALWVAVVGAVVLLFLVEKPRGKVTQSSAAAGTSALGTVLRNPLAWALGGSYAGLKLIRYSLLFWLPFYLHQRLGYEEGVAGYLSVAFEAGGTVGAIATGWIADRFAPANRSRLAVPMLLCLALALALYQALGHHGIVANASIMAVVGFLLFGPDTLISGTCAQDVGGPDATGSAAGVINGLGSIGAIFQGAVTAAVSKHWGWDALFYVFVATALLSAGLLMPFSYLKKGNAK